ncbi:MAG: inositol monophosphatase [Nanoarchaeota archaeon]|nr:inositol monophosphatase [Nanoarchaeota archaeon]
MNTNLEQTLVQACRIAGTYVRERAYDYTLDWKGKDNPVTNLDKDAEAILREEIKKRMPANFIGEEYAPENNKATYTFIIDPIDGTKSFIRREFYSAMSVGVAKAGQLVAGVVYDFMKDVMYVGVEGKAYILYQGQEKPFYRHHGLSQRHIAIDNQGLDDTMLQLFNQTTEAANIKIKEERGSFALSVAQAAAGTYDGVIYTKIGKGQVWDVAGAVYLAQQQGYFLSDIHGEPFDYTKPKGFIALRQELVKEIMPMFGGATHLVPQTVRRREKRTVES